MDEGIVASYKREITVSTSTTLQVCCKTYVHIDYSLTVEVPSEYSVELLGRAFLMETNQMEPSFRVAVSVEPIIGKYSCSLQVFLGDVKVWNSGHYSHFYTSDKCALELTKDGDLRLKGSNDRVGWRTGTSGQGVERLEILKTGNLVLVDALNRIKWQSFNFPTDVMLWGQRLNVATRLTSFPTNSTAFYSFEIQHSKIALYLSSGKWNYSYWEFQPTKSRNITFIELGSKGLEIFNDKYKKIAQISSFGTQFQPLRFLALGNKTGNMGLYFYSPEKRSFEAAFQALNTTCDLPLACRPYGICTLSNACSCIRLLTAKKGAGSDCNGGFSEGFCDKGQPEMLELSGVSSVLRTAPKRVNDGTSSRECFTYGLVSGVKQVERGTGLTFMVKVPNGTQVSHGKSNVKKWVLVMVGVIDGLIILLVIGGLGYCLVQRRRRRRRNMLASDNNNT
ncbi:hypothetical protein OIU77_020505 [Salix suchowensis]|uniref:Bulb-type lectin domain-containing protein n=1 Tax=Salix suchowensis TaxID=1278906 RepID=A0ABQ9C6R9_9ROSI|nr:hypothetical protein OIU77_020505 [Salix suchowensis]